MTLGQFLVARPQATPILETLRIDFCCGGGRDLDEVLVEHGLDPKTFLATVAALPSDAAPTVDAASMSTPGLIEHIVRVHHGFLKANLVNWAEDATKVARAHGARNPQLSVVEMAVRILAEELQVHLRDEEENLFPAVARGEVPADLVRGLVSDHAEAGELLAQIRSASDDFTVPEWGCTTYGRLMRGLQALEEDLHVHVHLENNVLFPRITLGA